MNLQDLCVVAHKDFSTLSIGFYVFERDNTQKIIRMAKPLIIGDIIKENSPFVDHTFELDQKQTQGLMDSLWDCGFRPTQGHGTAGQLDAMKLHLDDLRKICFHELKIR